MITFVCCSIRPNEAEQLQKNIKETIGEVPFEFIPFDNRELGYGLCKVYNICAEKARYPYICFLHEDVKFSTNNWGATIISKLADKTTGVIGFAGSDMKPNYPTGWYFSHSAAYCNYIQHYKKRKKRPNVIERNLRNEIFSRVITLDGMCLFVRKEVWKELPFDDEYFTGFHCYDVDFSLSVSEKYTNYVCHCVLLEHFSEGSFDASWTADNKRMHDKWCAKLPMAVADVPRDKIEKYVYDAEENELKILLRSKTLPRGGYPAVFTFIRKYPSRLKPWVYIFKNLKYNIKAKN